MQELYQDSDEDERILISILNHRIKYGYLWYLVNFNTSVDPEWTHSDLIQLNPLTMKYDEENRLTNK
jgi:hypothetical protein